MYFTYLDETFEDKNSFAVFLALNYKKVLRDVLNHKIDTVLKNIDESLANTYIDLTKNYKYAENKLTLLIYLLDKKQGIRIYDDVFYKVKDIYYLMRVEYPKKVEMVERLFADSTLRDIYKIKFDSSYEEYYLKYYEFFSLMYEYKDFDFTYYYFFYWHLDKGENIRFVFDNIKMSSIKELVGYLKQNENKLNYLLNQIKKNSYILALIARYKTLQDVAEAYQNEDEYALLNVLTLEKNDEFDSFVKKKMSYFLIDNYTRYNFKTKAALKLRDEYQNLKLMQTTKAINVTDASIKANELYNRFVELYEFKDIIDYKKGIEAKDEISKLKYVENGEYVSELFLKEHAKYNPNIHTEVFALNTEKEALTKIISLDAQKNNELKNEYAKLEYKPKKFKLIINFLMFILAFVLGGFLLYKNFESLKLLVTLNYDFSNIYSFSGAVNLMSALGPSVLLLLTLIMFLINLKKLSNVTKFRKFNKIVDKTNLLYLNVINAINTLDVNKKIKKQFINHEAYYKKNEKLLNNFSKKNFFKFNGIIFALFNLLVSLMLFFVLTPFINTYINLWFYLSNYFYLISYGIIGLIFILTLIFRKQKIMLFMPYLWVIAYAILSYLKR